MSNYMVSPGYSLGGGLSKSSCVMDGKGPAVCGISPLKRVGEDYKTLQTGGRVFLEEDTMCKNFYLQSGEYIITNFKNGDVDIERYDDPEGDGKYCLPRECLRDFMHKKNNYDDTL